MPSGHEVLHLFPDSRFFISKGALKHIYLPTEVCKSSQKSQEWRWLTWIYPPEVFPPPFLNYPLCGTTYFQYLAELRTSLMGPGQSPCNIKFLKEQTLLFLEFP